ncbi:hypothetical protein [Chromobacterium sphagni]|uniref:Uncharacterized protein n=1 Tax=Chromobacterium sphagni TaxID=1903179 RepID=A0A1S1X5J6_9NEIS|nr:hypothetical protein [Chromobacterium sphagni]OHX14720.1 hypothetical protein BI347_15335 [Chromobacterium sphagni]OHX20751.1 hypothetical protein BI344_14255 [Chromobacterium sphagni]
MNGQTETIDIKTICRQHGLSQRPDCEETKMKTVTTILLLAASLLAGCATQQGYAQKVNHWQGRDVNELLAAWGTPTSQMTMPNGKQLYTYRSAYSQDMPIQGGGFYHPWGINGGGSVYYSCTTNFVADPASHTVESVSFDGNDCIAPVRK